MYLSGMLFFAFRLIWHVRSLYKTIKKANINNRGPAKLIRASEFSSPFSFFNYVFVNPSVNETEMEEIMNHELVHVRQKHWFDLLIIELLRLLQWANPFVWIYTGFIRLNHEYLADEAALQRTSDPALYKAALLNQMFSSPVISLSNSFNYSLDKKRKVAMWTWIYQNLKYPSEAVEGKIIGRVYVNFVVSSSGKIKNVQVNKPVHPLLDAEAIRVISKMPDWKPGKQNGNPVDVDYMVPVDFKLQ